MNKKSLLILILLTLLTTKTNASDYLFSDIGINLSFNTLKLIGDNRATQDMMKYGGGLRYIEPGFDLSTTLFLDDKYKKRLNAGIESIFMNVKEVESENKYMYHFSHHQVTTFNIYAGYAHTIYKAP